MALQASSSSSSSSSSCCCFTSCNSFSYAWKYDVFLSFRGPDTRHGFTGNLYKALRDKGIRTFIDDEDLRKGNEITLSFINSIQESRIAISVFSKNYASSSFCLDELVTIMQCVKANGRLVLPVFYGVDPSDIRHQRGAYGEALARHEERFQEEKGKVQKWKMALHQAANLSGETLKLGNQYEYVLIEKIVRVIFEKISRVPLHVADYPVGLESPVLKVNSLLNDGSDDGGVHMVGIYEIGGIGKTTLARAVYNSIADQFEGLCFIENVSELSHQHGLTYLQEMVLSKILGEDCNLGSVSEGIPIIKERLSCKKFLLVLDDVDKHEQLQAIIGRPDWFGSGSRILITTRNKHLLTVHEVKKVYEVGVLNVNEALELFNWKAFKFEKVEPCYVDILMELVTYASGLPLALEVIGSNLFGKCVEEWRSALDVYKKIPVENVQAKLKVSFDALHPQEKNLFLDIACCFKGYKLYKIVDILHAHYNVDPTYTIRTLVDKSLIKISSNTCVILHDLIQDMGREIVRVESPEEPGARSRIWLAEDIVEVLEGDKGSSKIQIINLEFGYNGDLIEWNGLAFRKMENLRTLIIKNGRFSQGPKHLPNSLRVLIWEMYSSEESLPSYFHPKQLVILELPRNCFDSIQLGELLKKKWENMRVLKFDDSGYITKIPNLSSSPKLEVLSFKYCGTLTEIDESVGTLHKLKSLNAKGCSQLRSLPPLLLPSLEYLCLDECSSLKCLPEILGKMESLKYLNLPFVRIKRLPYSIHNLIGLRSVYLAYCGIVQLPSSIFMLPKLVDLHFTSCKGLVLANPGKGEEQVSSMLPSNTKCLDIYDCNISEEFFAALPLFPYVKSLSLSREKFKIIPECIKECHFLRQLHLDGCKKVSEILGIPPNLEKLYVVSCPSLSFLTRRMLLNEKLHEEGYNEMVVLPAERLPSWFEYQRRGTSITFWFRNKFPAVSFGFLLPSMPFNLDAKGSRLTINGAICFSFVEANIIVDTSTDGGGYLYICKRIQTTFRDKVDIELSENEWNRAVISIYDDEQKCDMADYLNFIQVGIHIIKEESSMDDIRFTDPLSYDPQTHTQLVQQQRTNSAPLELHVNQRTEAFSFPPTLSFNGDVNWIWNSKSMEMSRTSTVNVQGCEIASRKRKRSTSMLDLNNNLKIQSSSVVKEPFEESEGSFGEVEKQSSIRKRKSSFSFTETSAKIQKTATKQGVLTIFSKNHDKDSDVQAVETTIVPAATSHAKYVSYESSIHSENSDQPVNSLVEIQPPSPQPLDPLAKLERVLLGSYDLSPESRSPNAASCSDIQTSEVVTVLQNLEQLLDNPLESMTADGEIKQQILDCLSKLVQLEDQIPFSLRSIIAQVRGFHEDLIHNFPSIQQTLIDYSCLEETRSKFLENLKQAKAKQAQIEAEVSREKNQVKELDAEIADLEIKLKAAVEKRNELQLAIKNGEAEKNKILEDAYVWLLESKQVIETMRSSEHAYKDAQSSKARLEGKLATLKGAFASNKP